MQLYAYLNQFHPLTPADYELLAAAVKPRSFKKGHLITTPGQVQKELYFVKSGVQMSYFLAKEKTHVVAFTYAPGICAVPDSFSTQTPSACYLTCLSDTEADYISYNHLQLLFNQSQALERLFRKMTEIILAGVINRHIQLQALSMEERYKAFCKRSPHLLQLVPHKYVASYLGINATNFSKLFNSVKI